MKFSEKIYKLTKKIPRGKVTTYKELAKALNSKAYRAVGTAMRKNPYAPKVACHRVVKSNGRVGGFAERFREEWKRAGRAKSGVSGTKKKIEMLRKEGVVVKKGRVDLKKFGYRFI